MEHIYNDREDGLAHCKVCNGAEGSLTTDCCGEMVGYDRDQLVYKGFCDFRNGAWVSTPLWDEATALVMAKALKLAKYQHDAYKTIK